MSSERFEDMAPAGAGAGGYPAADPVPAAGPDTASEQGRDEAATTDPTRDPAIIAALSALAEDDRHEVDDPDPASFTGAGLPLEDTPANGRDGIAVPAAHAAPAAPAGQTTPVGQAVADPADPVGAHSASGSTAAGAAVADAAGAGASAADATSVITPGLQSDSDQAPIPGPVPGQAPDAGSPDPAGDAVELDHIEVAALNSGASPAQTLPFAPVMPTARTSAAATDRMSGAAKGTGALAWGARTDVGLVRAHNEDSFVIRFPLFAVADGMGGHEGGEVASTIAVTALADAAPSLPDDALLGAAIESANAAVIDGAVRGVGRPGMGTTCTAVVIDGTRMAVGHVGDSRCYLLHAGKLVRVTHDHSYVEELVVAGEITPEEARIHPNRSIITRALGSDPNMKADHFMVDVSHGDRVLLCSDGLSSMVTDDVIEEAMVCSPAPQTCADSLVDLALKAGGHDNVTCVVVDVKDDGVASRALKAHLRNIGMFLAALVVVLLVTWAALSAVSQRYWYVADSNGYVALYRGIPGLPSQLGLSKLVETSSVRSDLLSDAVEQRLASGITFGSEGEARGAIASYQDQVSQAGSSSSGAGSSSTASAAAGSSSTASAAAGSSPTADATGAGGE